MIQGAWEDVVSVFATENFKLQTSFYFFPFEAWVIV